MEGFRVKQIFITSERTMDDQSGAGNGNTDVIVVLDDGAKYTASFFTYAFIEHTRMINKLTGDFLSGKYFWGKNMVLVEECTPEIINPVIKDIIDEGEFNEVFRKL
jgi:hypothetical protein